MGWGISRYKPVLHFLPRLIRGVIVVLEWILNRLLDLLVPDRCYLCRRPAFRPETAASEPGLTPQARFLTGETRVRLIYPFSVTNHPFCVSCLALLKPSDEPGRLGTCGIAGGSGWSQTVAGDLFIHRPDPASGAVPGVPHTGNGYTGIRVVSPFFMGDESLEIIHHIKFSRRRSILPKVAGSMAYMVREWLRAHPRAILVPVPMHPSARRRRGFNQAEVLAVRISAETGLAVRSGSLRKTARTKRQSTLKKTRRSGNVRGVFVWSGPPLAGADIVLVDDLVTSGATVAACASVLKAAGAGCVTVLCFARMA